MTGSQFNIKTTTRIRTRIKIKNKNKKKKAKKQEKNPKEETVAKKPKEETVAIKPKEETVAKKPKEETVADFILDAVSKSPKLKERFIIASKLNEKQVFISFQNKHSYQNIFSSTLKLFLIHLRYTNMKA